MQFGLGRDGDGIRRVKLRTVKLGSHAKRGRGKVTDQNPKRFPTMLVAIERELKAVPTYGTGSRGGKFTVIAAELGEVERLHLVYDFVGGIVHFEAIASVRVGGKAHVVLIAHVT